MTKAIIATGSSSVELDDAELDQVTGGVITTVTTITNPAGNPTQGQGQALTVETVATNPAGHPPPGQN